MLYYRGGHKGVKKWDFNSADMDQGLMCHYFILTHGGGVLIDTESGITRVYNTGYLTPITSSNNNDPIQMNNNEYLKCCNARTPVQMFAHFTGRSKPWMNIPPKEQLMEYYTKQSDGTLVINLKHKGGKIGRDVLLWLHYLDDIKLIGINSSNIGELGLTSPLGFYNIRFPKGGFVKDKNK